MGLFEIIKSLLIAKGSLEKQAILESNKDDTLLKQYLKAVYDPAISYYIKSVSVPTVGDKDFGKEGIASVVGMIAGRVITGGNAASWLVGLMITLNRESQILLKLLLDRSIGANVGDTMILKSFPNLYFIPPYQRCSLMDDKIKAKFNSEDKFVVQTKLDGSFSYVVKRLDGTVSVVTRQGNSYPHPVAKALAEGLYVGHVLVGELEVYEGEELLERKTGNGLLNSVLKGGDLDSNYTIKFTAWDSLLQSEWEEGKSIRKYSERFQMLRFLTAQIDHIKIVDTWIVNSLAEAYDIYSSHTAEGKEGCVIKSWSSLWKNGTAKDIVKLKLKFQVEMRVIGMYEGEGKAKGMVGGVGLQSEDGLITSNCGSGFNDTQRKAFWNNPELILNKIVTIEANDLTQDRDTRKMPSLSLPIFIEIREEKIAADTKEQIVGQLNAAKTGGVE